MRSELVPVLNIVVQLWLLYFRKFTRDKHVVLWGHCNGKCRRDDDVGAARDELCTLMIQVVFKAYLHDCLIGLMSQN